MKGLTLPMARAHAAANWAALITTTVCCALIAGSINVMVAALDPHGRLTAPDGSDVSVSDLVSGASSVSGWMIGITLITGIFLIAQAIGFALGAREPEVSLLRLAGATSRQVARLVKGEATIGGAGAGLLGAALGWPAGLAIRDLITWADAAPRGLDVVPRGWSVPVVVVAGAGLAYLGSRGPAHRMGRTAPLAAVGLTNARSAMPWRRWAGAAVLAGGALALALAGGGAEGRTTAWMFGNVILLGALAALAPVLVPLAARLVGGPLAALAPGTGRLAVEHTRLAARRTAALAEPILLGVGIPGGLLVLVLSRNQAWLAASGASEAEQAASRTQNYQAVCVLAGAAVLMAVVALAASAVAGARERRDEFAVLRRSGATRRQVLASACMEAVLVAAVAALALAVDIALVARQTGSILALGGGGSVIIPIGFLGGLLASAIAVALVATLAGTAWALREPRGPGHAMAGCAEAA